MTPFPVTDSAGRELLYAYVCPFTFVQVCLCLDRLHDLMLILRFMLVLISYLFQIQTTITRTFAWGTCHSFHFMIYSLGCGASSDSADILA